MKVYIGTEFTSGEFKGIKDLSTRLNRLGVLDQDKIRLTIDGVWLEIRGLLSMPSFRDVWDNQGVAEVREKLRDGIGKIIYGCRNKPTCTDCEFWSEHREVLNPILTLIQLYVEAGGHSEKERMKDEDFIAEAIEILFKNGCQNVTVSNDLAVMLVDGYTYLRRSQLVDIAKDILELDGWKLHQEAVKTGEGGSGR